MIMVGVLLASVLENRVRNISPVLFEVAIQNLVCRYILGLRSVTYSFKVTVTLTSAFRSRTDESRAYLLRISFDSFRVIRVRQYSRLKQVKTRGLEVLPPALM